MNLLIRDCFLACILLSFLMESEVLKTRKGYQTYLLNVRSNTFSTSRIDAFKNIIPSFLLLSTLSNGGKYFYTLTLKSKRKFSYLLLPNSLRVQWKPFIV